MGVTRYGFVGCGMMGQEHIRNLNLIDGCAVTAIFEPDAKMQAESAKIAPDAEFYSALDALLQHDTIDALIITSPNFCHAEQLKQIANQRNLPILCEKPLYTDPDDAALITKLIENYKAPIWVGMEYRFMPPIAELVRRADDFCGGISMLSITEHRFPFLEKVGNWNRFNHYSGGTFVEKCCHFFDLMRLILKAEPVRVMASAGQAHNHTDESYNSKTPDIWDHGYVIVDFDNHTKAMLELSMFAEGSAYQERITAIGVDDKAEAFVPGAVRFWSDETSEMPRPKLELSPRERNKIETIYCDVDEALMTAGDHAGATYFQHLAFKEMLEHNTAPLVSLSDGMKAVKIGQAAQIAASEGRVVAMNEL